MASSLVFDLGGTVFEAVPVKLERKKLYGYADVVATDGSGEVCQAARLDPDGSLIVPPGGVKLGTLTEDGKWVERSELRAVDADGKELPVVPSSFGQVIALTDEAGEEDFLDHAWTSVYQLGNRDLAAAVGDRIFQFPFNYRADPFPSDGFLLAANGLAYLFTGNRVAREFTGLAEEAALEEEAPEEAVAEDEDLDFGML